MKTADTYSLDGKRIYIAGHKGMVGRALCRELQSKNCEILTTDFDMRAQRAVTDWFEKNRPDAVIIAAAKVGGIGANAQHPATFFYDNIMISTNVIHAAHLTDVEKLVFLGSSCIYPKDAPQPIVPGALLSAPLEKTNEAYAIAKIAGVKMCEYYRAEYGRNFISVMPCNLYGVHDRFDVQNAHVIPALMMKAHAAKTNGDTKFDVWGSGNPLREFLFVDDAARGICIALECYSDLAPLNLGSGCELSIRTVAEIISSVVGFGGALKFDSCKPDGTARKLMDSSVIQSLGWAPRVDLKEGLSETYKWYCDNVA